MENPDRNLLTVMVATSAVCILTALVIAITGFLIPTGDPSLGGSVLSVVAIASVFAEVVMFLIGRGRAWNRGETDIIKTLAAQHRRELKRQVAGRDRVDTALLPVLLAYARQQLRRRTADTPYLGVLLVFIYAVARIGDSNWTSQPLLYVGTALVVVGVILGVIAILRLRRFIHQWS